MSSLTYNSLVFFFVTSAFVCLPVLLYTFLLVFFKSLSRGNIKLLLGSFPQHYSCILSVIFCWSVFTTAVSIIFTPLTTVCPLCISLLYIVLTPHFLFASVPLKSVHCPLKSASVVTLFPQWHSLTLDPAYCRISLFSNWNPACGENSLTTFNITASISSFNFMILSCTLFTSTTLFIYSFLSL